MEDLGVHVFQVFRDLFFLLKGKIGLTSTVFQLFYMNSRVFLGNCPINVGEQAH